MSAVTILPQLQILLEGDALANEVSATLEEVRIQHRLSQPSVCVLTFVLPRTPVEAVPNFSAGKEVRVALDSSQRSLFVGEITAAEYCYVPAHEQRIRVRCYDKLQRLRKRQPVRTHVQVTVAELARELVADLGLTVEAEWDGPLSPRLFQTQRTDWELLVELARRFGLYVTLRDEVLHLVTLRGDSDPIALELGGTLLEARLEWNADTACRTVKARGWNIARVETHEAQVSSSKIGREVDAEASPESFGENGERTLTNEVLPDDTHAEAIAQAELDLRAAREVTFTGVAEGNAELMPGASVSISGVAAQFAGTYVLTAVKHVINRSTGFVSEISTELPLSPSPSQAPVVAWGTVTSVEDPERLGRVKVSVPSLGNLESDWMAVLAAGAGGGKGLVMLPDIGDQVLALFVGGIAAQGVVLGGLYGVHGASDYGIEEARVQRFALGTSGGQALKLDDAAKRIRLENGNGSFVELSTSKVLISSATDLEIAAPGRAVVVRGKTIDFRQA